jgi:hypothetical protein
VGRRRDDEDEGVSWIYILVYNTIQRKLSVWFSIIAVLSLFNLS